jgi:protein TonB
MKASGLGALSHGPKGVGWALAASLAVHGVALTAVIWGWSSPSLPIGVPVMDVELVVAGSPASSAGEPDARPPDPRDGTTPDVPVSTIGEIAARLPMPEPLPPVQAEEFRDRTPLPSPPEATAPVRPATASSPAVTAVRPSPAPSPRKAPPQTRTVPSTTPSAPAAHPGSGPGKEGDSGGQARLGARLIRHVAPAYPALARQRGLEGRVVVRLVIRADGVPDDISVAQSSGFDSLDRAAVEAIRQWRFEPARRAGMPVPEERLAPVVFRLQR